MPLRSSLKFCLQQQVTYSDFQSSVHQLPLVSLSCLSSSNVFFTPHYAAHSVFPSPSVSLMSAWTSNICLMTLCFSLLSSLLLAVISAAFLLGISSVFMYLYIFCPSSLALHRLPLLLFFGSWLADSRADQLLEFNEGFKQRYVHLLQTRTNLIVIGSSLQTFLSTLSRSSLTLA